MSRAFRDAMLDESHVFDADDLLWSDFIGMYMMGGEL